MNFSCKFRQCIALAISFFLLPASYAVAAAITFNTALPLSQAERVARGLFSLAHRSGSVGDNQKSIEQLSFTSVLGYGVTPKLSVFGVLPIRHIEQRVDALSQSDTAIGDVEIFSRYEVWRIDKRGTTRRIAPFAGVRLPSGDVGISSDGTSDVFAGVVFTLANIHQNFEAQIRYDRNGSNDQFDAGDGLSLDFSWQKRVFPSKITSETKGFWFAVLEAKLNYAERNQFNGLDNTNSGGFTSSLSPGMQYITRRWIGELAVRIPINNDLNGDALEPDYTVFSGIRVNF